MARAPWSSKSVFPPDAAHVELGLAEGAAADLSLKVRNGAPPFTWYVDGAPVVVREPAPELIRGIHNYGVRGKHFLALFSRLHGGLVPGRLDAAGQARAQALAQDKFGSTEWTGVVP